MSASVVAAPKEETVAILAEFTDVDVVVEAAKRIKHAGFVHWDVHSPFPIHGIDRAMGIRPTVLIGSMFYHGHQVLTDEDRGEFQRDAAERVIREQEDYAQRTGNPRILALQEAVRREVPEIDDAFRAREVRANQGVRDELLNIRGQGDPQTTREFLEQRRDQVLASVDQRAQQTAADMQYRLARVRPNRTRASTNAIMREELDKFEKAARNTEDDIWKSLELTTPIPTDNTRAALVDTISEMGRFETVRDLPKEVRRLLTVSGGDGSPTKVKVRVRSAENASDIHRRRSAVLAELRQARAEGDRTKIRTLSRLQAALLDDLTTAEGLGDAYESAVTFSRQVK